MCRKCPYPLAFLALFLGKMPLLAKMLRILGAYGLAHRQNDAHAENAQQAGRAWPRPRAKCYASQNAQNPGRLWPRSWEKCRLWRKCPAPWGFPASPSGEMVLSPGRPARNSGGGPTSDFSRKTNDRRKLHFRENALVGPPRGLWAEPRHRSSPAASGSRAARRRPCRRRPLLAREPSRS